MTMLFSLGTPVSSTNKADRHDKTEILLKVELNTITQPLSNPKSSQKIVKRDAAMRNCNKLFSACSETTNQIESTLSRNDY
jgi:hypothetical protein